MWFNVNILKSRRKQKKDKIKVEEDTEETSAEDEEVKRERGR